ncbi:MAG TPA: TRC40/GET3/ArsA family transport-energizing ATPase [Gemmatimonadaceae bacterium]
MSTGRTRTRRPIDELLDRLPEVAIIVGKGGVGKTTCAMGIASLIAARGENTLLVSTDPANALAPSLGRSLVGGAPAEVASGLSAMQLDPAAAREAFLSRWRDVLVTIVDRGTYLDREDIDGLVDASFPGADEIFGLLVLAQLLLPAGSAPKAWRRLVVDTAPTGHTLRLLELPETFEAMIALLESMQAKHRFMVSALTHRYRRDAADDFLDEMRRLLAGLRQSLGDATRAGAVLVTRAEPVVIDETIRYADGLRRLGLTIAAVVVEALPPSNARALGAVNESLGQIAGGIGLFAVAKITPPPQGLAESAESLGGLRRVGVKTTRAADKWLENSRQDAVVLKAGGPPTPARLEGLLRPLTIVGGKGGVGKTTVSCALAIAAALDEQPPGEVLLVSTDPAPSLGDALGYRAPRWAHDLPESIEAVPNLHVWQMDATAGFHALRERYRDRIDALFDSLVGRSFDIAHDRAILRDLLALAPPGIDELYALASIGEEIENQRYARIVVDPAPTGHLLRLLELPALAIEWSHRLMRLILKYKEIAGLGEAAQELLNFSRRTRALNALLRDDTRAGVVLVTLDEPTVRDETVRLSALLRGSGVEVLGEVMNRSTKSPMQTSAAFVAPEWSRPLLGAGPIREWWKQWQRPMSR